jgi:hypothetical protein
VHLGITGSELRRVTVIGAIVAFVFFTIGYAVGQSHDTLSSSGRLGLLVFGAVALGAVLPVAIYLSSALQLRVEEGEVQQSLFGRWLLARRPLGELAEVAVGGRPFPLVLTFRDGSRMRVLGAPLRQLGPFVEHLRRLAPHAAVRS